MFQTISYGKGYIHITNIKGRKEEFRAQLANGDIRGPFKSMDAAKAAITKGK